MEVFVDSSAWFRYVVAGRSEVEERSHQGVKAAVEDFVRGGVRLVTTNLLLAETHRLLLVRTGGVTARAFLSAFPAPGLELVWSDEDLERRAVDDWIDPHGEAGFSLADGVSFAVMQERKIRRALTLDDHFVAAGFEPVVLTR